MSVPDGDGVRERLPILKNTNLAMKDNDKSIYIRKREKKKKL